MSRGNKTERQIGALCDFMLDDTERSAESIANDLMADKIDLDIHVNSIVNRIEKKLYKRKSWQEIALEKKKNMAVAINKISNISLFGRDEIMKLLEQIIQGEQMQVQFRDFNELSDDDLRSLLEEALVLRKINESKNES